jgi:hypothetical protein
VTVAVAGVLDRRLPVNETAPHELSVVRGGCASELATASQRNPRHEPWPEGCRARSGDCQERGRHLHRCTRLTPAGRGSRMAVDELLTIGPRGYRVERRRAARLRRPGSPAGASTSTGYRSYGRDQLETRDDRPTRDPRCRSRRSATCSRPTIRRATPAPSRASRPREAHKLAPCPPHPRPAQLGGPSRRDHHPAPPRSTDDAAQARRDLFNHT